jgi:hypothetical protein
MQILVLEVNSSITLFNLNEESGNLTFEKINEIDNPQILRLFRQYGMHYFRQYCPRRT